MNPLWWLFSTAWGAVIGSIAAVITLSPYISKFNNWLRKPSLELKIWCVPAFDRDAAKYMHCLATLRVVKKLKGHEWVDLFPNTFDFNTLVYSQSRLGICCQPRGDRGFRLFQLRKGDEVNIRFYLRPENAVIDPEAHTKLVDYNLSPKIKRRKANISIDILPKR